MIKEIPGGVAAPYGFLASGVQASIKKAKKDVALIISETPAVASGVFTTNSVQAAPVVFDKEQLARSPRISVIVANSGNANACTGERGYRDAEAMAVAAAEALHISPGAVLVASTGVIGQFMPMEKVHAGIRSAVKELRREGSADAAAAIMTTDTYPKETAIEFPIGNIPIRIGCISKGSGMIAPLMTLSGTPLHATMLAFITTDAEISPVALAASLARATELSFNRISVDGDTSTNDTAIILANGQAVNPEIIEGSPEAGLFTNALTHILTAHAKLIAADGEGATKLVELVIQGARSDHEALTAARAVAESSLVKTAIHGADANWGRILAAVGYSGIDFDPASVRISFNDLLILDRNYSAAFSEDAAMKILTQKNIRITVDLGQGTESVTFWTCDLSREYITINASYRS